MQPLYFYHPDHLGTSTALTDINGEAYQFFLNLPFGETMAEQKGSMYYNSPYKFNGKELDEETGLYYYGARYYDPRISIWYSVDPLAEQSPNKNPYNYCSNNPIVRADPTGMKDGDSTDVKENKDGTYTVVGGKADGDKNIYVVNDKGKRTGNIIGESLTEYSFLNEKGNAVVGAIIDPSDLSGIDFLNNEIINNKSLKQSEYMPNAVGGKHYDFKARGRQQIPVKDWDKYNYRGMLFQGIDGFSEGDGGNTVFASARDIGNVGAGYFAGSKGWNWSDTRKAFDALQSIQEMKFTTEGKPSQYAQKSGHNVGYNVWAKKNPV